MTSKKTYKTAEALRTALSDRLKIEAKKQNIEFQRLSRQVAYDRLLARIFSERNAPFLLKGGYAMQLRVSNARGTKDIDLALRDAKLLSPDDVGVGDVWIELASQLESGPWLEFAGIPAMKYPSISSEQQFAEKIHAYTLPRGEGITNTRVKDLVDMVLLISKGTLDAERIHVAIKKTYAKRGTHRFNQRLTPPPASWSIPYAKLAEECELPMDAAAGFDVVETFLISLFP